MPFKYSCFISHSSSESDAMKTFLVQLRDTLESYIYLHTPNPKNKEVFLDMDRLGPGCHYNEELSCAICQSICMIVVYTPNYKHKNHIYCQREYEAMEHIENERIKMLGGRVQNKGMIIPIIYRGDPPEIPPKITNSIHYCDFRKHSTASPHIKRIKKCVVEIEKIAKTICDYEKAFNEINIDPCCKCNSFRLPSEEEIEPWDEKSEMLDEKSNKPITPFIWRGM